MIKFLICHDKDYKFSRSRCGAYEKDEPETVKWIESFRNNSVFYDIGSNIGGFSMIASIAAKNSNNDIKVYSFEPNFVNFYNQIKNILKNKFENVHPFNLAINNKDNFDNFFYGGLQIGSKGNFGSDLEKKLINAPYGNPFKRGISHTIMTPGISLDTLVYQFMLPCPNYIKIDVDGNEYLVLKGAEKLLKDKNLLEVFIEIDYHVYKDNEIENLMRKNNFFIKQLTDCSEKQVTISKNSDSKMRMVLYERR